MNWPLKAKRSKHLSSARDIGSEGIVRLEEGIHIMGQPIARASKLGLCVGLVISVLVLSYGYLEPHIAGPAINDWLIFIACPSSIALMAADNGKWYVLVFADLVVIVANTVWYGFLFAVAAVLLRRLSKVRISTPDARSGD
jgi:hypothetical protein